MTTRVYNFGAGPSMLPEAILKEAQEEFLDWQNLGVSVLEVGHRTPEFLALINHAEQTLRELLFIPQNYHVLFLGGVARTQFAMIPMNFLHPDEQAGYLVTGIWSHMALCEAQHLKKAYCITSDEQNGYKTIPNPKKWIIKENTSYVYYTPNETVNGIRFPYVPKTNGIPLIADMTSALLTEPIDIKQFGLIFAGAQKNIANAGLTIVIIRDDLLERMPIPHVPTMLSYKIQAEHHSLYATLPVFNCYLADKMFDWIKKQGGVEELYRINCQKAAKLYQYLDSTDFYTTDIDPEVRSIVNICFSLKNKNLENEFLRLAQLRGLYALKGHRLVGGIRASLYNAMPMAGVDSLIEFMSEFAKENSR
ncbi:3-phosphoserine/phosphohydroxythreonine transaminase [Fluoribacter dumoffii]|uniref:Phosphoserine aminotransferase n=1 Tax=Fluoribacter dumoffii TaxID=463 RepID=A0A377G9T5_9GAMM|nr:3-phosphoserine/phosphohydroxythreonine transaminase [Fluoribacter dumoffii]KTC89019.1 phosphoserine aminotransferase [Fluoribacter dumoffii NY 23]MCW8385773.1 3-phosphoserine/phosphohydroxythreonine transaminase [Fluoribacter dumoffii]MCW8418802.1 3-phosphoserine/phosphohydroxythreonine transaminase [Fluoribacter dumoffii]MCW8453354.1 3-phosphoserine/phosphohydroxythreonine transaminase [Fluoribacter dumoffii]MCW8459425.1 3-phosphoserine/phosphohydroxythreonine transaminase [Fluoribacter d